MCVGGGGGGGGINSVGSNLFPYRRGIIRPNQFGEWVLLRPILSESGIENMPLKLLLYPKDINGAYIEFCSSILQP